MTPLNEMLHLGKPLWKGGPPRRKVNLKTIHWGPINLVSPQARLPERARKIMIMISIVITIRMPNIEHFAGFHELVLSASMPFSF